MVGINISISDEKLGNYIVSYNFDLQLNEKIYNIMIPSTKFRLINKCIGILQSNSIGPK